MDKTGIATVARADGQGMLLYYQAHNGSIYEVYYPNSNLTSSNNTDQAQNQTLVPVTNALMGTPLTALSYTVNNTEYVRSPPLLM